MTILKYLKIISEKLINKYLNLNNKFKFEYLEKKYRYQLICLNLILMLLSYNFLSSGLMKADLSMLILIAFIFVIAYGLKIFIGPSLYFFTGLILKLFNSGLLDGGLNLNITFGALISNSIKLVFLQFVFFFVWKVVSKKSDNLKKNFVYLLVFICILMTSFNYNKFNGNPIAYIMARETMENYNKINYKNRDYTLRSIWYNPNDGGMYQGILVSKSNKFPNINIYNRYYFPQTMKIVSDYTNDEERLVLQRTVLKKITDMIQELYPNMEVLIRQEEKTKTLDLIKNENKNTFTTLNLVLELRIKGEDYNVNEIASILSNVNDLMVKNHNDKLLNHYNFIYYNEKKEVKFNNIKRSTAGSSSLEMILKTLTEEYSYDQGGNEILSYEVYLKE